MESPQPGFDQSIDRRLRRSDYLLLLLFCTALFGFSLVQPRVLSTHETVHCLNVREMFISGSYLIPTYGGRPWLERPPIPHWITGVFASLVGDFSSEWPMRLGSIFIATLAIFVFASAIACALGRTIGVMSGAILATTREFYSYATGPEADIFLASTVTIICSLFFRLQFDGASDCSRTSFFGRRGMLMLIFFLLLGLTNGMKGPLFGMIFVLGPIVALFAWNRDGREIRPFVWFWGWLTLLAAAAAWPLFAYSQYPDILELWMVDYGVRWESETNYLGEPFWYYFVNQPWNLFPWAIPAIVGLSATARAVFRGQSRPLRYVWCWALCPVLFFSLFKSKHHHYMLNCMAPSAALGALGAVAMWRWIQTWPNSLRLPWWALAIFGVPGAIIIFIYHAKFPGPLWVGWTVGIGWPVVLTTCWWLAGRRNGRMAFIGSCAVILAVNCFFYFHRSKYLDNYETDRAFLNDVKAKTTGARPLFVLCDKHPLTSSWLLYYLGERTKLLHNITFLRDDRITAAEIDVVCRAGDEAGLREFGIPVRLAGSAQTRGERSPLDRWALFRLRFHANLARMPGNVRISPMQATGRANGPYLGHGFAIGSGEGEGR